MNTSLPTDVTAGTPDLPGMLNESHGAINILSRDTSIQPIDPFLANGWTAEAFTVRRENNTTTFSVTNLNGAAATADTVFNFTSAAPGVSGHFVGFNTSRRSPLFRASGGMFYFAITENTFRCYFLESATATGAFRVDWTVPYGGTWPLFLPNA